LFNSFLVSHSYIDVMHFIIIHSLSFFSFSPLPLGSSNSPNFWKHVLYIFLCINDNACICTVSIFHMWEKTCKFCLYEPG
jgi:hypothetical protein